MYRVKSLHSIFVKIVFIKILFIVCTI